MSGFDIRFLKTEEELDQFFKLRHEVFTIEKKWVESEETESDKFDKFGKFLGVFFGTDLAAAIRLIDHKHPWMFEQVKAFSSLLKKPIKRDRFSVETTRYFVAEKYRSIQVINGTKFLVSKALQQALYSYFNVADVRKAYSCFTYKVHYLFRMQGLSGELLNENIKIDEDMETAIPVLLHIPKIDTEKFLVPELSNIVDVSFPKN